MTPDDYLGPRVTGRVRLESGEEIDVSARPRREGGFTARTVVAMHGASERVSKGSGVRVELLRWFAALADVAPNFSPLAHVVNALEAHGCRPQPRPGASLTSYDASCPVHRGEQSLHVYWRRREAVFVCRAFCAAEDIRMALGLPDEDLSCQENLDSGPVMGFDIPLTMRDARAVLTWLDNEKGKLGNEYSLPH